MFVIGCDCTQRYRPTSTCRARDRRMRQSNNNLPSTKYWVRSQRLFFKYFNISQNKFKKNNKLHSNPSLLYHMLYTCYIFQYLCVMVFFLPHILYPCSLARAKDSLYVEEELSTNVQFSRFVYLIKENICKNKHPSQIMQSIFFAFVFTQE